MMNAANDAKDTVVFGHVCPAVARRGGDRWQEGSAGDSFPRPGNKVSQPLTVTVLRR